MYSFEHKIPSKPHWAVSFPCSMVWGCTGQERWRRWKASQSYIPKDTEAKSYQFHSNFLCNGAELPCWGTDYKHAGYIRGNRLSFQKETHLAALNRAGNMVVCWPFTLNSGQLRSEGREIAARPGQQTQMQQEAEASRCWGTRLQCLPWPPQWHIVHSRGCVADDLLDKSPRVVCVKHFSALVRYKCKKPLFLEEQPTDFLKKQTAERKQH